MALLRGLNAPLVRRVLALGAAVAALVAFATLARTEGSSSARLAIGGSEAATDPTDPAGTPRAPRNAPPRAQLRPLDPATLADVPANLVPIGTSDEPFPSADGTLLGVPRSEGGAVGEVEVVDARTFQPLATVELEGWPIAGFVGFTQEADALVVHRRAAGEETLTRHPFDGAQQPTTVALPARQSVELYRSAMLAGGRVALLGVERGGGNGELSTFTAHALVADLLEERVTVDLPLPGVRVEQMGDVLRDGPLHAPGLAWDAAGERLYLAHADAHRITVVDLATGTLHAEVDLDSRAPGTEAPATAGTRVKHAQLSPDGARLYVTGRDYLIDGPGPPLGLSVVDTATLTEVGYVAGVSDWVEVSPDGRWLAWTADTIGEAASTQVSVLDTRTLEETALLGEEGGWSIGLGFSLDSAHLYVRSGGPEGAGMLRAHALPSLEQTGERSLDGQDTFAPSGGYLRELVR